MWALFLFEVAVKIQKSAPHYTEAALIPVDVLFGVGGKGFEELERNTCYVFWKSVGIV